MPKTTSWKPSSVVLVAEAERHANALVDGLLAGEQLDDAVDRVALELLVGVELDLDGHQTVFIVMPRFLALVTALALTASAPAKPSSRKTTPAAPSASASLTDLVGDLEAQHDGDAVGDDHACAAEPSCRSHGASSGTPSLRKTSAAMASRSSLAVVERGLAAGRTGRRRPRSARRGSCSRASRVRAKPEPVDVLDRSPRRCARA